ncbi:MAG TPA: hypothetical protein VE078_15605 [Thermoanaerobaculia bacterium]|nr:hypothetical protein [Thermoanaerobaculia bacterium]
MVEGNGFVAGVIIAGRALVIEEEGRFWVEGVNPGGFSAGGDSRQGALFELGSELRAVLFDFAADSGSFEEFRASVEQFFHETSAMVLKEWEEAVEEIRAGKVTADWLKTRPADSPLSVVVVLVRKPQAHNNRESEAAIAA